MELKDVILSTIAEMDDATQTQSEVQSSTQENPFDVREKKQVDTELSTMTNTRVNFQNSEEELKFLENVRERLLVLFEGFQSPNNTNIEAKIDLTLNFLEYLLATIDTRVDILKSEK